jgi:hypothetical protein
MISILPTTPHGEADLLEPREFSPVKLVVGKLLRQVLNQFFGFAAILVAQGGNGQ